MTASFIIDCSITMAWLFADERTAETESIQERLILESVLVPSHWYLEVANVLVMAEKRKRISAADSTQFVQLLETLDIVSDSELGAETFDILIPLCRSHGLTSYDAAYLDLAMRRQLPLATLDDELRRAAVSVGIPVLGK